MSLLLCVAAFCASAQSAVIKQINQANPPAQALAPLRFLASDELMGRSTIRPEINIAARYISEQFRSFGVKEVPGTQDYFQTFDLKMIPPASSGSLVIGNKTFQLGKDLVQASGTALSVSAPVVFAGFGSAGDLANIDVRGKIVVTNMGENDASSARSGGRPRAARQKLLQEKGAVALVERYRHPATEWEPVRQGSAHERMLRAQDSMLPVLLVHDADNVLPSLLQGVSNSTITTTGNQVKSLPARNVMGWVEGTDARLKDQFIVLSAHYDHVGVAAQPKMEGGKLDSIYNGARDNAIGVAAIINAARYFAAHPPKRSVLFIAYTGEEMGMLGSQYFAAHPTVALNKMVYNINIDNAGYNDTTLVTVVGLGRTSADDDIKKASAAFGLTATADPAPEQNLFDRSDNVSLAIKGVPAPTFSLGFKQFDESLSKYYHQLGDEVGSMDTGYALKYMKSFILAAKYVADNPAQPQWKKGDKYEAAWKKLYQKPL